jgi:hypothetical protein
MANVGTASAGKTLIGKGNTTSPTFADVGTDSGLTNHGILIAQNMGAFVASAAGTAGQIFQSGGAAADPLYSTATYPSTTTINQILYSSANNTVAAITAGNFGVLISDATGVPSWLANGTTGQMLTATTGGTPSWTTPTAGTVTSVSGTLNRITSTGGATPVIDIAATYVGQTSLTTLGTITTGTWNATAIDATHGGTAQTTWATGDILYASGVNTLAKLAAGSNTQVLTLAGGVPTWATPTTGTVTSVSGTLNRITSTGGATPVIDIAATYVGQTSITTLGTITTGVWNGTVIDLAHGGTNANLTASNGGIFYSTATAGAILAGTATAGQILRSGASGAPSWSTATYPATAGTSGNVLTSDGTNWISASPGTGFATVDVTGATQALAVQTKYLTDNAGGVTYTLPASGALGDEIRIIGKLGLATIAQNANQQILLSSSSSTIGVTGSLTATNVGDCIWLVCITAGASTVWRAESSVGNWTVA